jgi:uncharacterized protein
LDANILFSAAKSDGAIRTLLRLMTEAGHVCVADDFVVAEARKNLEVKDARSLVVLQDLLGSLEVVPHRSAALPDVVARRLRDKDHPVLGAAIGHGCNALVTGDRTHFGFLYGQTIEGVTIYSPRGLAEDLV